MNVPSSAHRCLALAGVGFLVACTSDVPPGTPPTDGGARDARIVDGLTPTDAPISGRDGGPGDVDASRPRPTEVSECGSPDPSWIFCSGFEEPDFSSWDDYDGNPSTTNQQLTDPGAFDLSGNRVGRLRVPPGRGGADFVKVLPRTAQRVYARWYEQWEPGYDFNAPNHGSGLHAGSRDLLGRSGNRPAGNDWYTGWIEPVTVDGTPRLNIYSYYAGMYMDCADPAGSCYGDHFPCMVGDAYCTRPEHAPPPLPTAMETGRWYCIEEMLDGGAPTSSESGASGALDFWIDGAEVGPWSPLWMRTDASVEPNILWLSVFHHADHSVAGVLFDDVVVSTERVGCR